MTDEQKVEQQAATEPKSQIVEEGEYDPVEESTFLIDEENSAVSTVVGTLGGLDEVEPLAETDIQDTVVVTEVGSLGWPEGAENEQGLGPDGNPAENDADPSWTVEEALPKAKGTS